MSLKTTNDHLIHPGISLNPTKRKARCLPNWRCKRVAQCELCARIRRTYFISTATEFCRRWALDAFATVSWPLSRNEEPWSKLRLCCGRLSRGGLYRIGKYVRVIAIGKSETPHVHLLIRREASTKLRHIARRKGPPETRIAILPIDDVGGLLGYLFDQNGLPAMRRTDRPRRIRILSGSRGLRLGFPTKTQVSKLKNTYLIDWRTHS